ncbi:VanZ family protein [Companilactobacillus farciminis]|uniref:VanZ family protein n=1 Tax=Companilactobacillus farciminis TaxID=1612 RepID=UPI0019164E29|nr:VanZ family protein [Companilactobacillus farciminis]
MRYIPLLIILTLAICLGLIILNLVKDFEKKRFNLVSLVYLTFLAIILFTPISFDGSSVYVMPAGIGQVNLHKLDILELGFAENIILTVPLGFLIKYYLPKISIISMALVGFFTGGLIETTQFFLSHIFLINRTSDINDVIANALGIVVGSILLITYEKIIEKTSSKQSHV